MTEADVVKFIYKEARLLDEKRFDEWYELFADDAYYWVPLVPGQTDPLGHNSLAYEDKLLLKLRIERLKQPNAFSQKPGSRCLHVLQAPEVEKVDGGFTVRSRSFAGAPFRRKVQDSITVLSAASGRATRIDWIAPLMVRLG